MWIDISTGDLAICEDFATKQLETSSKSEYRRRGHKDESRIRYQIIVGKLAEVAVAKVLGTEPDFAIYEQGGKDYSADMAIGNVNVHVKGQDIKQSRKYGTSWLFQRRDDLIQAPDAGDFIALCTVDVDEMKVKLYGLFPASGMTYGFPKAPAMAATKVALYLEDMYERAE